MQQVVLGRTGLKVSVAALGAGGSSKLGQSRGASTQESVALVQTALDLGVNFLDTAAVYGTENIIGQAIRGRRDDVVISTKVLITEKADPKSLIDGRTLRHRIEESLRQLDVDTVDIMHLHGVMPHQYQYALDELLPAMQDMRADGKIRFSGATEYFGVDTTHTMATKAADDAPFDVLMVGYNCVNQTARKQLLPLAHKNELGTMCMFAVRGPLARLESANALVHKLVDIGEVDPENIEPENPLGFLLDTGAAETISEAAYRFCRHTPGVDVVVTGTGSQKHLRENLEAIQKDRLPRHVMEKLEMIFAKVVSVTGDP